MFFLCYDHTGAKELKKKLQNDIKNEQEEARSH